MHLARAQAKEFGRKSEVDAKDVAAVAAKLASRSAQVVLLVDDGVQLPRLLDVVHAFERASVHPQLAPAMG